MAAVSFSVRRRPIRPSIRSEPGSTTWYFRRDRIATGSLIVIIALYTVFLIVELYLMTKFVRLGPSSLHTGRYHFEQESVT